jgi:hypothetical protein
MKKIYTIIFLITIIHVQAQEKPTPTDAFSINGELKAIRQIGIVDIEKLTVHNIGDVVITNHAGEVKGTAKGLKGVKLKELMASVQLLTDNPRLNSTYYFIMKASDGYTVVFSWNEIFNSPIGEKLFIVTSKDGVALKNMTERLLLISPTDLNTGRRYVKGLSEIQVKRAL